MLIWLMTSTLFFIEQTLEERREKVAVETRKDVLVWSNDHVIQWVESLGFATNLRDGPEFMVGSSLWTAILITTNLL